MTGEATTTTNTNSPPRRCILSPLGRARTRCAYPGRARPQKADYAKQSQFPERTPRRAQAGRISPVVCQRQTNPIPERTPRRTQERRAPSVLRRRQTNPISEPNAPPSPGKQSVAPSATAPNKPNFQGQRPPELKKGAHRPSSARAKRTQFPSRTPCRARERTRSPLLRQRQTNPISRASAPVCAKMPWHARVIRPPVGAGPRACPFRRKLSGVGNAEPGQPRGVAPTGAQDVSCPPRLPSMPEAGSLTRDIGQRRIHGRITTKREIFTERTKSCGDGAFF